MPTDRRYIPLPTDQIFTHEDQHTGFQRSWNVGAIMRVLRDMFDQGQIEPFFVQIDPEFVRTCWKIRGLEKHRLARLTPQSLTTPILFLMEPDETALLLDGTHRYVYAHQIGRRDILSLMCPQDVADKAQLDLPQMEDFLSYQKGFSGIR